MEDPQLKYSIDRLYRRIGSWWRIFWLGLMQGAGAVVGATILVLLAGWILNFFADVPLIGDVAEGIDAMLEENNQ